MTLQQLKMHLQFLTKDQLRNTRPLEGDYHSSRHISMYIRHDFIRELMLNSVIDALASFIPSAMIDPNISRRDIRL